MVEYSKMNRFFVAPQHITNKFINFDTNQSRKIRKVLRLRVGDTVEVFDGRGNVYTAQFTKITTDFSIAQVVSKSIEEQENQSVILVQALPKNLKVEFILQKCTELGVDKIIFFESEYSQINAKGISKEKINRWKRIASEASEQCKRLYVPEIELALGDLESLLHTIEGTKYVLDHTGKYLTTDDLATIDDSMYFFVGPEGGFSPTEKELLHTAMATSIKLTDTILRSETAGMAFLSQLKVLKH